MSRLVAIPTAAANAITILNNANQPLNHSDRNWRGLRISGADLSYAILEHVQWQEGDLRNVNFYGAYLKEANFSHARLYNCQWPMPNILRAASVLGTSMSITALVYTWDGKLLIVGGQRGQISFYSTTTYQCMKTLKQYSWNNFSFNYPVSALAVDGGVNNRNSRLLASAASTFNASILANRHAVYCGVIYLWKLPSGQYLGELKGHKNAIDDLQLTANGRKLLSHGTDGSIFIWDPIKLKLIQQFKRRINFTCFNFKIVNSGLFSVDVSVDDQKTICLKKYYAGTKFTGYTCWFLNMSGRIQESTISLSHKENKILGSSLEENEQLKEKIVKRAGYFESVSQNVVLSPSGRYIVFVQNDGQLKGFGASNVTPFIYQKTPQAIAGNLKKIRHLRFSPDERYLAACGYDGRIVLWSIETDELPAVLNTNGKAIKHFVFSVDGGHIAAISSNEIQWINLHNNTSQIVDKMNFYPSCIALSVDSSKVSLGGGGEVVFCLISSNTLNSNNTIEITKDSKLSSKGQFIVSKIDKKIALFSVGTGGVEQITNIDGCVLNFSIDESCFFFETNSGIGLYSLKSGKTQQLNYGGYYKNKQVDCLSPSGKYIVNINKSQIELYTLGSVVDKKQLLGSHDVDCDICGVCFSSDNAWLVSFSYDKTLCIWSTQTGKQEGCFIGNKGLTGGIKGDMNSYSFSETLKLAVSVLSVPFDATFSPDSSLVASASGGLTTYTIFIYTRQGKQQQKLVKLEGYCNVQKLAFSSDGRYIAVFKISLFGTDELHLWDWRKGNCMQRIILERSGGDVSKKLGAFFDKCYDFVWHDNIIHILFLKSSKCWTYYKDKNDNAYRLNGVIGTISSDFTKISLQGTRGLTKKQHQLFKAQGAQGKPKSFAHIINDKQDAIEEKKELSVLKRCRKGLVVKGKVQHACPALFEPQKHINNDRWHVILFRITECTSQLMSNGTNTTQASTSEGAVDYHVYGFLEGLDAAGRSVMIQFDLVEDRYCPKYARIKHKCVITESQDLKSRQQAFMTMFNREKTLPSKLCIRIAGTLDTEQRDALLDTIIEEQQRQFDSQELWQERRIRYQKTGGIKTNLVSDYFSANCLTWLYHILQPYKLNLPHSIWDNVVVNPRYTLSESGFFRQTSSKIIDVSGWETSVKKTSIKSFK